MATPTKDIQIFRYGTPDGHQQLTWPVGANVSLFAGTVAVSRSGFLIDPSAAVQSGDVVLGMILGQAGSNPVVSTPIVGGTTNGTVNAQIETGSFFLNSGSSGDAIAQANAGAIVFLIDHQTVGLTNGGSGGRPPAGRVLAIDNTQGGGIAVQLGASYFNSAAVTGIVP